MICSLLCLSACLFASSAVAEKPYYDLEIAESYFEEFITVHGKTYAHQQEKQRRFEIFKYNLIELNYLNNVSKAVHGITKYTDHTKEEFARKYNSCLPPMGDTESSCRVITDYDVTTSNAPASLDYRQKNAVSPVKSQDPCQNCWAFSSVGGLEGQQALKHGQLESLSPQQLMDCLQCSGHCAHGGLMINAFSELISTPGVESDADYPYAYKDLQCQFDQTKAKVRVVGCNNYRLSDEEKLKEALYEYGPISIGINSRSLGTYHGGIFSIKECPAEPPGHAVLLVGYGTEAGVDYWLIKNSWGLAWGEEGYLRITRGENTCGLMNDNAASPIIQ